MILQNNEQTSIRTLSAIILLLFLLHVILKTAWLCDDAFITFRTVDNFTHGYGLTWNPGERVQVYTHPLWMFILSFFNFFTGDIYTVAIFLSVVFTMAAVIFWVFRFSTGHFFFLAVIPLLICSKAFIDYSTSGLENPLSYFLIVLFYFIFFESRYEPRKLFYLSLSGAFCIINRQDLSLMILPCIILFFIKVYRNRDRKTTWRRLTLYTIGGMLPLILWEFFSLFYYGFPFPNTYYAKLTLLFSRIYLLKQGAFYFFYSIKKDPVTIAVIFLAIITLLRQRNWKNTTAVSGIILYLLYVLYIGGDFMGGRFLSVPFFAALIIIDKSYSTTRFQSFGIGLICILISVTNPLSPLLSGNDYYNVDYYNENGVADERGFYYLMSGLYTGGSCSKIKNTRWGHIAAELKRNEEKVTVQTNIGIIGYFSGPRSHIVCKYGLSDALLSKLPARGRTGHYERRIPAGYIQTLRTGRNQIEDVNLSEYYEVLSEIIKGKLFDIKRILQVLKLNTGYYDHLLKKYIAANTTSEM